MPIYPYLCGSCGHTKDVLQKIADAPLTQCPSCGVESFSKQLSAPAFQLKGSGWYVTDFRDGNKKPDTGDKAAEKAADQTGEKSTEKPAEKAGDSSSTAPVSGSEPSSVPATASTTSTAPGNAAATKPVVPAASSPTKSAASPSSTAP